MLGGLLTLLGCSEAELTSDEEALAANPLEECPDSPNCVRFSRIYDTSPEALLDAARAGLEEIGASSMTTDADAQRIEATFSVFVFTDDVEVAITPADDDRAALHVRSASRVGRDDMGVNSRRVERFLEALDV